MRSGIQRHETRKTNGENEESGRGKRKKLGDYGDQCCVTTSRLSFLFFLLQTRQNLSSPLSFFSFLPFCISLKARWTPSSSLSVPYCKAFLLYGIIRLFLFLPEIFFFSFIFSFFLFSFSFGPPQIQTFSPSLYFFFSSPVVPFQRVDNERPSHESRNRTN